MSTEFIELAGKVNQAMPYFCLEKIERALNDEGRAVRGAKVLVLGVAYKAGTSDTRESPALKIIDLLTERGAEVSYHDPFVADIGRHGLQSVALEKGLEGADLAVIVTAHAEVDHEAVARRAPATVDLRGVTRSLGLERSRQL
jgi:UDP-N-acetyl-D-glucosamine dehydrogenase